MSTALKYKNELQFSYDDYRCVKCKAQSLRLLWAHDHDGELKCDSCKTVFPIQANILDTLVAPDVEVIKEMKGMAREMGLGLDGWKEIKIRRTDKRLSFDQCIDLTKNEPHDYYRQTLMSFTQALEIVKKHPMTSVLEIGACNDFAFLKMFSKMGARCVAANIHFDIVPGDSTFDWAQRVLADMNNLPFNDASFDLVFMSATSHHSPDLEKTIQEMSRVLRPGGVALVLNDQISGWLKVVNFGDGHGRDNYIHENYYSISRYDRAFKQNGFRPEYLFSDYFDQKLLSSDIHPKRRFARVAKFLSIPWRNERFRRFAKRKLLWPAHKVFGFPLNAVLWKA